MQGARIPYPELPISWTIFRKILGPEGAERWAGLNIHTGEETALHKTYGAALQDVEAREVKAVHNPNPEELAKQCAKFHVKSKSC